MASIINLSAINAAEVAEMTSGIRGQSALWTVALRPATRVGKGHPKMNIKERKPLVGPRIEE